MTQKQLNEVLKQHKLWLDTKGEEGKRADLRNSDLRHADLRGADLKCTDLRGVNLRYADLEGADLSYADLRFADLEGAGLSYADLRFADLTNVDLRFADLEYVNLIDANLESTGVCFFIGPCHRAIYNSKGGKLYIGCQVHTLDYWLNNYVDIGRKYKYTDEEIEEYGNWFKSLKELL